MDRKPTGLAEKDRKAIFWENGVPHRASAEEKVDRWYVRVLKLVASIGVIFGLGYFGPWLVDHIIALFR